MSPRSAVSIRDVAIAFVLLVTAYVGLVPFARGGMLSAALLATASQTIETSADAQCAPVVPQCGCGMVMGPQGCQTGDNKYKCACSQTNNGFTTAGVCVADGNCKANEPNGQSLKFSGPVFNETTGKWESSPYTAESPGTFFASPLTPQATAEAAGLGPGTVYNDQGEVLSPDIQNPAVYPTNEYSIPPSADNVLGGTTDNPLPGPIPPEYQPSPQEFLAADSNGNLYRLGDVPAGTTYLVSPQDQQPTRGTLFDYNGIDSYPPIPSPDIPTTPTFPEASTPTTPSSQEAASPPSFSTEVANLLRKLFAF